MVADDWEPLYHPQENALEDTLRREAERVASQDSIVNKIVYDSVETDPTKPNV